MSSKKGTTAVPSAPTEPSGSAAGSLTPAQLQEWSLVLKRIGDNKWVVPAVIVAGIAGLLEILHLLFLAFRFVYHWIQGSWQF